MAKIPFDIKFRPQIESGEYKVETRDGRQAKVMDWAFNDKVFGNSIAIKVTDSDGDYALLYKHHGKQASIFPVEEGSDLIIITPEPEFSEFEVKLWEIMKAEGSPVGPREKFTNDDKKAFHEYSAQLLAIAKDEIYSHESLVEYAKAAKAEGKAEALKGLPRWVKVDEGDMLDKYSKYLLRSNEGCYYYCCGTTIARDGYMLLVDNLEKLPKEDEI